MIQMRVLVISNDAGLRDSLKKLVSRCNDGIKEDSIVVKLLKMRHIHIGAWIEENPSGLVFCITGFAKGNIIVQRELVGKVKKHLDESSIKYSDVRYAGDI